MTVSFCRCGSMKPSDECCAPLLSGIKRPETALSLMRSRYTAYCLRDGEYLLKTWHTLTQPKELDLQGDATEWAGLLIISCEGGEAGAGDTEGVVEFIASYRQCGELRRFRERSRFVKEDGEWLYLDGVILNEPKQGRNDPCFCGSGKKYKKCCASQL